MSVLDSFRKKSSLDTFRKQKTPEQVFATPQAPQATQQLTPEQTLAASQQAFEQGAVPVERTGLEDYAFAVEDAVKKRGQELAETERDYQEGKINTPEYILQTAGKGVFGTAADVAGETFMAGAKALTPEFLERRVAELASAAAEGVMTSDQWEWAKNHWDELSPRARKNLESAFNTAFGVAAVVGKAPLQGVGKKMSIKGMAMRRERIANQVIPDTPSARQQRALNPNRAAAEERMVNTLMSVKGISHTKSPLENFKILNKELDSIDNTMRKSLSKHSNQTMNRNSIQAKVNNVLDALQKSDPGVYADKSLKQVYDRMNRLLFDPKTGYIKPTMTPVEILQARRNLDAAIKKLAGGATDQSKIFIEAGAQGDIIRAYRNTLNDIIDAIPTDIDTKALRGRSSDLLLARKNYGRLADEKTASIMDMIERHPLASMATIRTGSSSLPILGGAIRGAQAINRAMPDTLVGTGNILQSPVGAAPAAGLFYTDKENQQ